MLKRLRSYWNRDKLRCVELLVALEEVEANRARVDFALGEAETALEVATGSLSGLTLNVYRYKQIAEIAEHKAVEAAKRGMKFEKEAGQLRAELKSKQWSVGSMATQNKEWSSKYDKANADANALADELVEMQVSLDRFKVLNSNDARAIREKDESIKEHKATIEYLRDELQSNENALKQESHRIVLAVAALTRELPARPANEVRVEMETFTLN